MSEDEVKEVRSLYMEILEQPQLSKVTLDEFLEVLKPDSLFERFAARKANQVGATKEFMDIKGQKFQMENETSSPVVQENEIIAFKCLHYSVTESAGVCSVTIVKKQPNLECVFGIRTREGTAKAGTEYEHIDEVQTIGKREQEKTIEIKIFDNQDWQPDFDFYVELYETKTQNKLFGDDTECKITILDEDFPGKLGFEVTQITASRNQERIDILINRVEGTDGKVSCMIKTESMVPDKSNPINAVEFEDYLPRHEKIEFASGESSKLFQIMLVKENVSKDAAGKTKEEESLPKPDLEEDEDDVETKNFKVLLERIESDPVKISRKNCCTIELKKSQMDDQSQDA